MRKYQETSGYWVYAHVLPTKEVYIGMSSQQPWQRWNQSLYRNDSLEPYITEYGWQNIEHKVLIDGLTKEQAEYLEDWFIRKATADGFCVNERRSGGYVRDDKQAYMKQYNKQRYSTPAVRIYYRVASYNQKHPDKAIETPMEAKQKYLQCGYIPVYIKHDDIQ